VDRLKNLKSLEVSQKITSLYLGWMSFFIDSLLKDCKNIVLEGIFNRVTQNLDKSGFFLILMPF
jgi:hypothetical protein